ncbi:MAG: rhodanese-like domain-containing protein [Alphaproteobacteria bacterium]
MSGGAYPIEVSVHDLKRALDEGSATVVDVREPWEAEIAKIEGARLVPLGEFAARAAELPRDKPILIHCHHGGRSMQATHRWLRRNGYGKVSNVAGGIDAWSREIDPAVPRYWSGPQEPRRAGDGRALFSGPAMQGDRP